MLTTWLSFHISNAPRTAMPSILHKPIAWFLIATLVIVTGAGEALHMIPGCGHGVLVGDTIVLLGISLPDAPPPSDGYPHFDRPGGPDIPIYDEDQCAICSVVGQTCTSVDSAQFFLVVPLVHDLPAVVLRNAPAAPACLFQARAPPLA